MIVAAAPFRLFRKTLDKSADVFLAAIEFSLKTG
jgi:hypothetical protein